MSINGPESSSLGVPNHFRYKGYYYDAETNLYFLKTRYYSLELCRFISPDSVDYLDPESINGLNLYAYCENNSVNMMDLSGCFAIALGIGISIGTYKLLIALGIIVTTVAVIQIENQTHFIENSIDCFSNFVNDLFTSNDLH